MTEPLHSLASELDSALKRLQAEIASAREALKPHVSSDETAPLFVVQGTVPLDDVERRYVEHVLALLGGNKTHAAQLLKVDPSTLHRKLARWESERAAR